MSTQMNPWLAEIYGTNGADDFEKTAQAHLLQKLAAEGNIDISQFTPEELEQLVQELAAEGHPVGDLLQSPEQQQPQMQMPGMSQGQPGQAFAPAMGLPQQQRPQAFAPANQQPQMPQGMNPQMMQQPQAGGMDAGAMQKEAQAKFEEADLLGRVMAHAYTDELEKIAGHQKIAGTYPRSGLGRLADKGRHHLGNAASSAKGALHSASNRAGHAADRAGSKASSKLTELGMKARHHKGAIGAGAVGAAGGFAAGRMSKKASAFEKLAEEHAADILATTGYDPSTGQDVYGQEMLQNSMQQGQPQMQQPQPGQQQPGYGYPQQGAGVEQPQVEQGDQFTEALDSRALELLAENGYDVNEILARIQLGQQQQPQAQA